MPRIAAILASLVLAVVGQAADWPQWLGPKRDGSTDEKVAPWKGELKVLWRQALAGAGHSSPVVSMGRVFLHTKTGKEQAEQLTAFDAADGTALWHTSYPRGAVTTLYGDGPRATPAIVDGRVYCFGLSGLLTCFAADKGTLLWQVDTAKDFKPGKLLFGPSCSPLVEKDAVLVNVGGMGASIVAFDKNTGKVRWQTLDDGASYSSPIALGEGAGRQVVFLTQLGLVSLKPEDGTVLWQSPLKDRIFESSTTPLHAGDMIVGSSITAGSVGLKLEAKESKPSVTPVWKNPALTCYFSTPVAFGADHFYAIIGELVLNPLAKKKPAASLRCVETATGKELWKKAGVGAYHASLLRTGDGKLLMLEEAGSLVLLEPDAKEYRELARAPICGTTWAHPAVAQGRLYVRDANELICIELAR